MDLANLSSNWKQLQKKLKVNRPTSLGIGNSTSTSTSPPQPTSSKRKRSDLESRRPAPTARRKKPRSDEAVHKSQNKSRRSKMNGTTATSSEPASSTTTTTATAKAVLPSSSPLVNAGLALDVEVGKYIALDCEMVGIGPQPGASAVARVSLVNYHGAQLYDSYVLPTEPVTDWRTHVSGISPAHMRHARSFREVQRDVAGLLKDRVLVGHSVRNDLEVLGFGHPRRDVRDTARFPAYRRLVAGGGSPRLKDLAAGLLGLGIQEGEHSSVEDARATMMLFRRDKEGV